MSTYLIGYSQGQSVLSRVPFGLYPDNSPVVNVQGGFPHHYGGMVHTYTTYQDFVSAMMLARRFNNGMDFIKSLVLPYVPGARQDKPRDLRIDEGSTGDVLATLEWTASLVKLAGFKNVTVLDPHSPEVNDAFAKVGIEVTDNTFAVVNAVKEETVRRDYDGIIVPDFGAVDRGVRYARVMQLPLYFGRKRRDPVTNHLSGFDIPHLQRDSNYLVVDDICDGGGTFMGVMEQINNANSFADLFVTHGLFTKGAADKLFNAGYESIYTTDSVDGQTSSRVRVLPITMNMIPNVSTVINMEEGKR